MWVQGIHYKGNPHCNSKDDTEDGRPDFEESDNRGSKKAGVGKGVQRNSFLVVQELDDKVFGSDLQHEGGGGGNMMKMK